MNIQVKDSFVNLRSLIENKFGSIEGRTDSLENKITEQY